MVDSRKNSIIKYITILCFIVSVVTFKKDNINYFCVLFILLFVLNNQIRFYMTQLRDLLKFLSICIELAILYKIYNDYGGILFFCYFPAAFDCAFLIKSKLSYAGLALVLGLSLLSYNDSNYSELTSAIAAFVILFLLAQHIKDEHDRKIEAQDLYDKLRVSEEKLKKANYDLETYANSIEELTLLRERNRISREIHDSVGHSLSTIIIQLGAIEKIAQANENHLGNGNGASAMAKNLGEFVKDSLQEVRLAVRELKPEEFENNEGLLAIQELINKFVKFTSVDIKLGFSKERWCLNSDKALVVYRAVQEFLSNAVRHGKATKISIYMNFIKDSLIITMQDNGIGASNLIEGVGLKSIAERTREVGGSMSYNSELGNGFFLKLVLYKVDKIFIPKEQS